MAEAACKAAQCIGGCLDAIVADNARETAQVAVKLSAAGVLRDDQLHDLIDLYTDFEKDVKRRKREDRELREKTKVIILG